MSSLYDHFQQASAGGALGALGGMAAGSSSWASQANSGYLQQQQMIAQQIAISQEQMKTEYDYWHNLNAISSSTSSLQNPPPRVSATKKERTMFQEIKNDVSTFVKEHRGVIYFIALFLLVDHFIFKGVFKERLQKMMESLVKKVEDKVAA